METAKKSAKEIVELMSKLQTSISNLEARDNTPILWFIGYDPRPHKLQDSIENPRKDEDI